MSEQSIIELVCQQMEAARVQAAGEDYRSAYLTLVEAISGLIDERQQNIKLFERLQADIAIARQRALDAFAERNEIDPEEKAP
jgi:hypothetical protein